MYRSYIAAFALLLLFAPISAAQQLPPCAERPTFSDPPWVDGRLFCPELVIEATELGELPFTILATAPDGTLYAARPLLGQVLAIRDSDGDLLPDEAEIIAGGLSLPNGLAYHEDALYIAAGTTLYRWDGSLTPLVDDLPVLPGGWIGGLALGPDERLYVALGPDSGEGTVLSFTLDGDDRRSEARGLSQAAQMAFLHNRLWATDNAPASLLQITEDSVAAAYEFPAGSRPWGIAAYEHAALPILQDTLLVVLNGSQNQTPISGYELVSVQFDEAGQPIESLTLIPQRTTARNREAFTPTEMNYRASGFWPERPLGVAVSPEGWVYVSVSGGAILALRPLE